MTIGFRDAMTDSGQVKLWRDLVERFEEESHGYVLSSHAAYASPEIAGYVLFA